MMGYCTCWPVFYTGQQVIWMNMTQIISWLNPYKNVLFFYFLLKTCGLLVESDYFLLYLTFCLHGQQKVCRFCGETFLVIFSAWVKRKAVGFELTFRFFFSLTLCLRCQQKTADVLFTSLTLCSQCRYKRFRLSVDFSLNVVHIDYMSNVTFSIVSDNVRGRSFSCLASSASLPLTTLRRNAHLENARAVEARRKAWGACWRPVVRKTYLAVLTL